MLSLEPVSMRNTEFPSSLADPSAYGSSATTFCRFGSYTSWCFHIDKTIAAMRRASVSLARFGLVPARSLAFEDGLE
jgi:hypothetical protein